MDGEVFGISREDCGTIERWCDKQTPLLIYQTKQSKQRDFKHFGMDITLHSTNQIKDVNVSGNIPVLISHLV